MPYISKHVREQFDLPTPATEGDLNYCITQLALNYIGGRDPSYARINAIIGALECAKLEFYRRYAAKYEDIKITENGDVYV